MGGKTDDIYLLVLLGMGGTFILSITVIFFYLRYQRKFYAQREQIHKAGLEHQIQLLNSTIQSQENERKRIGRDLHDEVGGALANLRLAMNGIVHDGSGQVINEILNCKSLTDAIINTVRNISHNLSPSGLELFGLTDVLEELFEQRRKASGLLIVFQNETNDSLTHLSHDISIAIYRIAQELLTNTLKHAGAKQVFISLKQNSDRLLFHYSDDGKGIDLNVKSKGIGMYNIESRLNMIQASYSTGNIMGSGFSMQITIPLPAPEKAIVYE